MNVPDLAIYDLSNVPYLFERALSQMDPDMDCEWGELQDKTPSPGGVLALVRRLRGIEPVARGHISVYDTDDSDQALGNVAYQAQYFRLGNGEVRRYESITVDVDPLVLDRLGQGPVRGRMYFEGELQDGAILYHRRHDSFYQGEVFSSGDLSAYFPTSDFLRKSLIL